jgi:putative nucleotidyltransferase with HDIG domain
LALKILLCDPDEEWLASAAKFLTEQLYEVKTVYNGKDAQLALYNDTYFAVVLNIETRNHTGLQVLKFIKTNYTNQNVIMVVSKEVDGDREKLIKMGARDVIAKPFEVTDLCQTLEGHQSLGDLVSNLPKKEGGNSEEEEVSGEDANFTKIPIGEFFSSKAVLFDIFVRLSSGRYVKILHAGDVFDRARIDKYKNDKGVEFLYFHNKDRRKFVQFNNFLAKKLINNKQLPSDNKVAVLKNVTEKYIEEVYTVGMKPQVIEQGKQVCENVYNLIEKDDGLFKLLKSYQAFDPTAFTHCFLVTLFSSSIIKQFEWQSKTTIETTALACMFHDIGKMSLPKGLLEKKTEDMNEEELEEYKKHPELGLELVEGNRMLNNSVKQIILQHHESFDGTGFPFGKKGASILTLANIVSLADRFVHIMIDQEKQPMEALKHILTNQDEVGRFNSVIIENFINVFVDPGKITKDKALPANSRIVRNKAS